MVSNFCPDAFWNTSFTWVDTNPDFTECFKQTFLVWAPCTFLLIFSPFDLYYRFNSRYSDIPWSFLNIVKSIAILLLISLTFVDMVMILNLRNGEDVFVFDSQIVSVSVKVIIFIWVALLQYIHKIKGQTTSGLLFLFWLVLVIFAIPQLRSEIQNYDSNNVTAWKEFQFTNYIIYFTLISILLLLNCYPDKLPRKTTFIATKVKNPSPEQRSSFLNQIFFQWFTYTTYIGFRRPLNENDVFDINPENTAKELIPPFDKYFAQSIEKGQRKKLNQKKKTKSREDTVKILKETNGSVLPAIIKAYCVPLLHAGFLQLIIIALLFAQPFLLNELINFTALSETAPLWQGFVLTSGLFLATFFSAIINGQYYYRTALTGIRIKTGLMSAIHRKALRISIGTKKDTTVGEIVNLMSVDSQQFNKLAHHFHDTWSTPIIMITAFWLLYDLLGLAVFPGIAVMFLVIPVNVDIYSRLGKLQCGQMAAKDERVKYMNQILTGMRVLKLYAWEPSFESLITGTRATEMKILKKIAILNAKLVLSWTSTPFLVSMVSFITFVLLGEKLTPNVVFVSMTLFSILQYPLEIFPMMISSILKAAVSVKRINKFMNAEEINPDNVTNKLSENALSIDGGNFTWGGESTILKNINMKVKKDELTALVGPVGCGKSSILSALLGEMEKISGTVNVDGRIAYVPQQAWIQNASLEDNILFGRPMNQKFYDKVIQACALTADLAMLPGGDQTEIGEKGINLSGGQKQRVSLARAVYSEADIYLLDDPLSAVDSHVGKHIFDNVFDETTGLLRGKSRLLVTHAVAYLPKVNEIYVMMNGEITESGSYEELLSQKGLFAAFLMQHLQEIEDDDDFEAVQSGIEDNEMKVMFERSISKVSNQIGEKFLLYGSVKGRRSMRITEINEYEPPKDEGNSKLIDLEEAASGSVGIAVYIRYFKSIGVLLCVAALAFNAIDQAIGVYSNSVLQVWTYKFHHKTLCHLWLSEWSTDERAVDQTDSTWRNIYILVYFALGGAKAVASLISSLIFGIGCLRAARDLHKQLLHNVMRLAMSFFDTTPSGRILNRFSSDVNVIDSVIPLNIEYWVMMVFNVLAIFVVISYSTPWFLVLVVPIAAIYFLIQNFFVSTSRQLKRIESITLSPIYNHFNETLTGQTMIRAYGEVKRFISESEDRIDHNQTMTYSSIIAARWIALRLESVGALVVLFACLFAVLARDTITPAAVGLSISYALQISQNLSFLVSVTAEIETNIVAIERVNEYSNRKQEAPWKTVDVDPAWPQKGVVKFENFQVRYREGLGLVLKGINFSVNSEEKIGIVGRTGAGKSSLTLAMFRIIEAAEGKIIIDDIDIAEIGLHSLRSRLTIIPQDPVLFSGSLRMNIDPFNASTDDQIWMALEQSHLKTFVMGLPEGLNYMISESGGNLSIGQRQLVCLSRALLRKTKVLILDEATAAIDIETDELIQKTIRTQFKDCTILTIAHRLNTIMDSDRVIVLDQGQIAEFDTPEALLSNKSSIFYGMAKDAGITNGGNATNIEEECTTHL